MASVVAYLLVSNPSDPEGVKTHPVVQENEFELRRTVRRGDEEWASLQFDVELPLEDHEDLVPSCRELSSAHPEAYVVLTEMEERFSQVERLRTTTFHAGKRTGGFEHGRVFNVGEV